MQRQHGATPPPTPLDIDAELGATRGGGHPGAAAGYFGPAAQAAAMGAQGAPGTSRVVFPPDYFPPRGARYFRVEGTQNIAGPGAAQLGPTFVLPGSSIGAIRDVDVGIANMLGTTVVQWQILIDGASVEGWTFTLAPRIAAYVSKSFLPQSTRIKVPTGSTLQVRATISDGGTYDVSASVAGWFYSDDTEAAYYGV